jgi:cytochrome P450
MTTHDILLDSDIFPEPNTFNPERWLVADPPSDRYFVAFGKGTRMCQGMKCVDSPLGCSLHTSTSLIGSRANHFIRFAYTELYLVIATLLRRYNFQLYDTQRERDIDSVRDCFVGEPYPHSLGIRVEVLSKRP